MLKVLLKNNIVKYFFSLSWINTFVFILFGWLIDSFCLVWFWNRPVKAYYCLKHLPQKAIFVYVYSMSFIKAIQRLSTIIIRDVYKNMSLTFNLHRVGINMFLFVNKLNIWWSSDKNRMSKVLIHVKIANT